MNEDESQKNWRENQAMAEQKDGRPFSWLKGPEELLEKNRVGMVGPIRTTGETTSEIEDANDTAEMEWEAEMEKVFFLETMQDPERQQQMFSNVDSLESANSYLEIEFWDWMSNKKFDRR